MKANGIILILVCAAISVGCTSLQQKRENQLSQGLYSAKAAIAAGRIDQAEAFINSTSKLVAAPKKPIVIKKFTTDSNPKINTNSEGIFNKDQLIKNGQSFIVLPSDIANDPVVVKDSEQFNQIIKDNPILAKEEVKETKNQDNFIKTTDKVVEEIRQENLKPKESLFTTIFHWFGIGSIFSIIAVGAGLIAVAIFFPAAWPLLTGIFSSIVHFINYLFGLLAGIFKHK